ncbi:hypothetical protein Ngar_c31440 [Candidatus Nitrososphaera gargensis Ga9.2]|uniref:Uncharacterized protein n=1 Tax=Nitrososphaera gargensis (strain Ga9.2) TaxID=1237085 RepID=K0IJ81_NITGG|nr:hypothetical protein [Candidatus Nitrososphaera gargensis]AFU60060.1 hypothetical protein Ngar_c31440 [Candidatus Nitrososphaera gargensis Ga9.2]
MAGHRNQRHGKRKKKKAAEANPTKNGARVGYHSEAANPPELISETGANEGMEIGYHSEVANTSKTEEDVAGMQVGYHSERANPQRPNQNDGMKIGYHSEVANPPREGQDGMNIGYHSEAVNIGSHSKRLHGAKGSLEERADDASNR